MKSEIYWLNKDSRKFLERGYLLEGESPEQRIKDIGDRAQSLLGDMDGFSDKFCDYMARGFILYQVQFGQTLVAKEVYLFLVLGVSLLMKCLLFLRRLQKLVK